MLLAYSNNEQELLKRIADGDEAAYRCLYEKYVASMYNNALHFTKSPERAKDLTQDIFLKVWINREKLRSVERFDAFLYVMARNIIFNELKKQLPKHKENEYLEAYLQYDDSSIQTMTELKDLEKQIHEVVNRLPPQMQTAFRLSRFEGLTHEQIAARMGISQTTSKSYIVRALLIIRKHLAKGCVELINIIVALELIF